MNGLDKETMRLLRFGWFLGFGLTEDFCVEVFEEVGLDEFIWRK